MLGDILGTFQFIFLGSLEHRSPMLRSAYAACELFALPSTLETPGLAALEAAAQGVKIIITEVGATKEYFGENVCYIRNPIDPDEIAERIHQAIELNSLENSKLLAKIIEDRFCWQHTIQTLARIYRDAPVKVIESNLTL